VTVEAKWWSMAEIGEEIIDQASQIFEMLDQDGSGTLEAVELCKELSNYGIHTHRCHPPLFMKFHSVS